ncbi:uncharacterized protein LOC135619872 isoform X2 [Musa acuminata AAA Group]|uniref:uncharacterized protein LOC135619872 isoform X2 n=1 Tax=Musa acuminata AAA Group TaxID=214697 RepID=UPI0008A0BFDA|nr:PREDICTED: uncharacterized protein LOC103996281 isoform X2 [Musa acuminata subsp. malaccensis]
MEEYMENVKRLRTQINVRTEIKRLNEEAAEMLKAQAQTSSEIAEKQKKMSSLETESCTLSQTLELLQQEMTTTTLKHKEKRSYYARVTEDLNLKLREQQEWYNSKRQKMKADAASVDDNVDKEIVQTKGSGNAVPSMGANLGNTGNDTSGRNKDLEIELESAKTKLAEIEAKKSEVARDSIKSKQLLEEMSYKLQAAPPALREMDVKALEEEHRSLVADKAGELEYLQSLKERIKQLKNISHIIKCRCGKEYNVELVS